MDSITAKFKQALHLLKLPNTHHHVGDKQMIYITFSTSSIPSAKKQLPDCVNLAIGEGYKPEVLSVGEILNDFFKENPNRESWFEFDNVVEKWEMEELFQDHGTNVKNNQVIENAILQKQKRLLKAPNGILIITDLEMLHPFSRFGPIEQSMYHKIKLPIIVLYPGDKAGSALKF